MRLLVTSKSFIKGAAACASMFTLCISPVAQGAAAKNSNKQLMAQYLKETGLSQKKHKITANEFYKIVRTVYPDVLRSQLDPWFAENKNETLPQIEASSFVDANNVEQVRLTLSKDGETMTVTFTGDDDFPMKVNGVTLSRAEILNPANFAALTDKLAEKDAGISKSLKKGYYTEAVGGKKTKAQSRELMKASLAAFPAKKLFVNAKSYKGMSTNERIEYFMRIRAMTDSAELVHDAFRHAKKTAALDTADKYEVVRNLILGNSAQAAVAAGGKCLIAGFVSTYGSNLSCGTDAATDANSQYNSIMSKTGYSKTCQSTEVPCNPLVYGFNNSGNPYCIPTTSKAAINSATKLCNQQSPLSGPGISAEQEAQNKKRIVESFLKAAQNKDAKINPVNRDGEFKIPPTEYEQIADYIGGLKSYISEANTMCQSEDGRSTTTARPDQLEACEELATRAFDLKTYADKIAGELPPPVVGGDTGTGLPNCDAQMKGSVLVGAAGKDGNKKAPNKKANKKANAAAGEVDAQAATGYRCECPSGTAPNKEGTECVSGKADVDETTCPNNKPPKNGKCEKNRSWLIPLGIGVLALGALWWLTSSKKKKSKNPTYVPPVNGTDDPTNPTNPPVTPPTNPEPNPCVPPNVMINGQCTSVIVYGGEGGTAVDDVNRGGGVRSPTKGAR